MSAYYRAGVLFLVSVILLIFAGLALGAIGTGSDPLLRHLLNALFVSLGALGIPACFFLHQNDAPSCDLKPITLHQGALSAATGFSLSLIGLAIGGSFIYFGAPLGLHLPFAALPPLDGLHALSAILAVCVIPSVTEELFFRGILLSSWRVMGKRKVILLTSLLFSLMHTNPFSMPATFFISCVAGELAYESRSVYPGMIIHFTYNLFTLILYNAAHTSLLSFMLDMPGTEVLYLALSYLLLGILIFVAARKKLLPSFAAKGVCGDGRTGRDARLILPLLIASAILIGLNVLTFFNSGRNIFS